MILDLGTYRHKQATSIGSMLLPVRAFSRGNLAANHYLRQRMIERTGWRSRLPGCFAGMTAPFGVHPKDEQRAERMFHLAMREGATTEQIVREATRWLKTQGVTDEGIARQIQRIKKFSANPMRKSRLESAWLITWEGTNPPNDQRKRVASILSGRTSSERVREYVEQLHVDLLYSLREKLSYARNRKANPYPAEFVRIDGVQWGGRITCGHNPHLAARKVKNLRIVKTAQGGEILQWEEVPIQKKHPWL